MMAVTEKPSCRPSFFLHDALTPEPLIHSRVFVVLWNEMHACLAASPLLVQLAGNRLHALLVAAAVADHHEVLEAVRLETGADVGEKTLIRVLGQTDRAGILHVAGRRVDAAFGHERHDRSHQSVAEFAGDRLGGRAQNVVVLAGRQIGPILFDSAGWDDDRCLPRLECIADFHPRKLFDKDRIEWLDGSFCIRPDSG